MAVTTSSSLEIQKPVRCEARTRQKVAGVWASVLCGRLARGNQVVFRGGIPVAECHATGVELDLLLSMIGDAPEPVERVRRGRPQTWLPNPKRPEVHEVIDEAIVDEPEEEWRVVEGKRVRVRHVSDSERAAWAASGKGALMPPPDFGDTSDHRFPRPKPVPERDWIGGKAVTKHAPRPEFGSRRSGIPWDQ
jgi:hypothetical protein